MIEQILVICLFLALGGMLKGVLGMGTPIIAVPAIAAFFGVPYAIAVMVIPNLTTNCWQVWQFRAERGAMPFLTSFVVSGIVGVIIGTWLLTALPEDLLSVILGLIVLGYIALRLTRPDWVIPRSAAPRLAPATGSLSGLMQGATGISAPVSATFLNALRLSRPEFAFAISALFAGFALTQLAALALAGILTRENAWVSVFAIAPVLAGMWLGNRLARHMDARLFDRLILVVLAIIALKLFYDVAIGGGAA